MKKILQAYCLPNEIFTANNDALQKHESKGSLT